MLEGSKYMNVIWQQITLSPNDLQLYVWILIKMTSIILVLKGISA